MVFTGPDICPLNRGQSSFCSLLGQDLYGAADKLCSGRCTGMPTSFGCEDDTSNGENCLCELYCAMDWTAPYDFIKEGVPKDNPGVSATYQDWFGWYLRSRQSIPAREASVVTAADSFCDRPLYEDKKDDCNSKPGADCLALFQAWRQAEDCSDGVVADAAKCKKVCEWIDDKTPPKVYLNDVQNLFLLPVLGLLVVVALYRAVCLLLRARRVWRESKRPTAYAFGVADISKEVTRITQARESSDDE